MGFITGRATWLRFHVDGPTPDVFGQAQLDKLSEFAIGKQRIASADGVEVGWGGGEDILDTDFDLAKNIISDALHFALRVDSQKLPGDLLRAYARVELRALAAKNPSGHPSNNQKKQAREAARDRLEAEAKDGRYQRRKSYPLFWDRLSNSLFVGSTSANVVERVQKQFGETFGCGLTFIDSGRYALQFAERTRHKKSLDDAQPAAFLSNNRTRDVAWVKNPASLNYLGNEFFLWLWFVLETEGEAVTLADKSEVTVMLGRMLLLECPEAQSGSDCIRSEIPVKLPEAWRAIQAGKLARRAGLTLVRHDQQYELTLQAETLAVTGAKLPSVEESEERARLEERMEQLRHLQQTLDLLYDAFLNRRLTSQWAAELERMRKWLRDDKKRLSATG